MPKALPPAAIDALSPPPTVFPYTFFEHVDQHPFKTDAHGLNLRNAWWLMDAAFLSYSSEADIRQVFQQPLFGSPVAVRFFSDPRSTQCYVASSDDWIVLAFRGTQVDDFWASVIDWSVDARFVPIADSHGDAVHAGFLSAAQDVWPAVAGHLRTLQTERERPLWITGHSLGAALATVAANLCSDHPDQLGLRCTYTYGSPRVGDRNFGRHIQRPLWRFRNDSDIVTHVPLGLVFRHVGALGLVDAGGHFHADSAPAEEALFEAVMSRFSAGDPQYLSALLGGVEPHMRLPGILADHAPINYGIRLWNCYEATEARAAAAGTCRQAASD